MRPVLILHFLQLLYPLRVKAKESNRRSGQVAIPLEGSSASLIHTVEHVPDDRDGEEEHCVQFQAMISDQQLIKAWFWVRAGG